MIRAVLAFLLLFASISGVFFVLRRMVKTPEQLKRLVMTMVFVSFVTIISLSPGEFCYYFLKEIYDQSRC